jgi:hypothetical protein
MMHAVASVSDSVLTFVSVDVQESEQAFQFEALLVQQIENLLQTGEVGLLVRERRGSDVRVE